MLTRCPSCATVFRVTVDQLKAKQAMVRCGKCRHGFNALDALLDAQPEAAAQQSPAAEAIQAPPNAVLPLVFAEAPAEAEREAVADPLLHESMVVKRKRRTWPWALGSLLLLLLLLLQLVVQFRNELVVLFPDAKPALQQTCALFGCRLSLPHKPDLLGIEASDLHPDPGSDNRLLLAATLKNRAPFVQAYPDLELTLTDTADQPLLRKVIAPGEYLPKGSSAAAGFAANGEIAVNLTLEVASPGASGYRLYLFYP